MSGMSTLKVHCIFCVNVGYVHMHDIDGQRGKYLVLGENRVNRIIVVFHARTDGIKCSRRDAKRGPARLSAPGLFQTQQPTTWERPHLVKTRNAKPAVCGQEPRLVEGGTISTHADSRLPYVLHHTEATGSGGPRRFHKRHQAHGAVPEARRQAECSQSPLGPVCPDQGDGCGPLSLSSRRCMLGLTPRPNSGKGLDINSTTPPTQYQMFKLVTNRKFMRGVKRVMEELNAAGLKLNSDVRTPLDWPFMAVRARCSHSLVSFRTRYRRLWAWRKETHKKKMTHSACAVASSLSYAPY
jgi:hypothetical protein